jgi:hypothetical protein
MVTIYIVVLHACREQVYSQKGIYKDSSSS